MCGWHCLRNANHNDSQIYEKLSCNYSQNKWYGILRLVCYLIYIANIVLYDLRYYGTTSLWTSILTHMSLAATYRLLHIRGLPKYLQLLSWFHWPIQVFAGSLKFKESSRVFGGCTRTFEDGTAVLLQDRSTNISIEAYLWGHFKRYPRYNSQTQGRKTMTRPPGAPTPPNREP